MLNYNVSYLSESGFSLVASFRMHHASFFRPRCLSLRGHVIVVKQKFIVDGGELVPLVVVHGRLSYFNFDGFSHFSL